MRRRTRTVWPRVSLFVILGIGSAAAQDYVPTSLGVPAGYSGFGAAAINNRGQIVGSAGTSSISRAFLWDRGQFTDLGTLPGGALSNATAINDLGEIVGWSSTATGDLHAFIWLPVPAYGLPAGISDIGANIPASSYAYDINDAGQVVGLPSFLWQNGVITSVTTAGAGSPVSVNNAGSIVTGNAWLFAGGQWTPIGSTTTTAIAINDSGQVAGRYDASSVSGCGSPDFVGRHAYRWQSRSSIDLDPNPGDFFAPDSSAAGINSHGDVVGIAQCRGTSFGFVYDSTNGMRDLNALLVPGSNLTIASAKAINDLGMIVAEAPPLGTFLLTPTHLSARAGNVNAAAGLVSDVLALNGSTGTPIERRVEVAPSTALRLSMLAPPSNPGGPAPFVLYAWLGEPSATTARRLPRGLGYSSLPTPLSAGEPQPLGIANNVGHAARLGVENWPHAPTSAAPVVVLRLSRGLRQTATFYVQGIVIDAAAPNGLAAVTNGIVVVSR
ncbi:MAG: DUF3466 family protein [Planctomycetes bacterium]|nr:DUF3466 family protein [Planctomycetota bacterium]MBI3845787.1 DUF3466 family protein [Planctomycetota bacterium]